MRGILVDILVIESLLICFIHNVLVVASGSRLVARRAAVDDIPYIGITDNWPASAVRMEINDMYKDKPLFNLYILALDRMMKAPKNHRTSYYAISGIHGTDQVYDNRRAGKWLGAGYGIHDSQYFSDYHRVYVALFETSLFKYAKQVFREFNTMHQQRNSDILNRFRVPYWDWASNASLPNWILFDKSITVDTPTGRKLINNPLYAFRDFIPNDPNLRIVRSSTETFSTVETLRSPTLGANNLFVSQPLQVAKLLNQSQFHLRIEVYNLFQKNISRDFELRPFETTHGSPHIYVGGLMLPNHTISGHMTYIRFAAFDPVFWLHHCNVDRQFAILQVLNPKWISSGPNEIQVLYPFWNYRVNSYFTTLDSRRVTDFGYTYPELQQTADANHMRQLMHQKYGDTTPRNTIAQAINTVSERKITAIGAPIFDTVLHTAADPKKLASKGRAQLLNTTDSYNEFQAAITLPSDATTGSFSIHLFMGSYTSDPSRWIFDSNYVGSMDCFTLGSQSAMKIDIRGSVFLTQALLNLINRDDSGLIGLRVKDVRKFLKKNLKYEVQSSSDVKVDTDKLKIEVQTARVKTPKATTEDESALNVWGPWRTVFTLK